MTEKIGSTVAYRKQGCEAIHEIAVDIMNLNYSAGWAMEHNTIYTCQLS